MSVSETVEPCDIAVADMVRLPEGGNRTFKVGGVWWDRERKVWMIGINTRALGILWHSTGLERKRVEKV